MNIRELSIEGAWEITPLPYHDDRGLFLEWYREDRFRDVVGHPLKLSQLNLSVSTQGVVRGIHYCDVPPGQAKYVMCASGAVLDVIVDLRAGSPTFGQWEGIRLDDNAHRAVYLAEGLGHGYCALTPHAAVAYLCSETYQPTAERAVDPLDPALGITWPVATPIMSTRDSMAPRLQEARLPDYHACQELGRSRRSG